MFKVFPFGFGGTFDLNQLGRITNGIGGIVQLVLNNIDIYELSKQCEDTFSYMDEEEDEEEEEIKNPADSFIKLERYEDMYLLIINLKGIDLRELSIRYDPGIIEINLNRSEIQQNNIGYFTTNTIVKKRYKKGFEEIEDIDTSIVMKNIDNGILRISMPKKYILDKASDIIDVENYIENE